MIERILAPKSRFLCSYHTTSKKEKSENESHSVVSDSLRPQGLYSPWNSPGQNTGVGSLSFLLPNPRTEPKSLALQADSLPAEPQGKPYFSSNFDLSFQSQTPCGNFLHRIFFRFHLNCAHLNLILALGFTSSPDSSLKSSFLLF